MTREVYRTISYIENIPRTRLKFLTDLDFEKDLATQYEETQVCVLMDKGKVQICAPKDTVYKVSAAVWEAVANIRDLKLEISQNAVEILKSRTCQAFMKDQFTANNLQAALAFDLANEENVFVMGMKTKVVEEASELVKRLIVEECLELDEDQAQLDKSEKWRKLRYELTEKRILSLSFDRSNKRIRLVGTKEDVLFALKAVERFLKDNTIVSSVVELPRGCKRYLAKYRVQEIRQIEDELKEHFTRINGMEGEDDDLVVSGTPDGVIKATSLVDDLASKVLSRKVFLDQPGMRKVLDRSKGKKLMSLLANEYKCVIEHFVPKMAAVLYTTLSKANLKDKGQSYLEIFAETKKDIDKVVKELEKDVAEQCKHKVIERDIISKLSKQQKNKIKDLEIKHDALVTIEEAVGRIIIRGDAEDVLDVATTIHEILNQQIEEEIGIVCNRNRRPKKATKTTEEMEQELRNVQEQLQEKELKEANLREQLREKYQQEQNTQKQFKLMEQQSRRTREQLQETSHALKNAQLLLKEEEQQLTHLKGQLREKELQESNLREQLREKDRREQNTQRQFRLMEQQVTRTKEQLQETSNALENAELLLKEGEQQLTHLQGQLREKELQEANLREQLREKDRREQNSQIQLREMAHLVTNLQEQSRDNEQETASLYVRVTTLEGQLREKDREVNELENTLSTAQQALSSRQRQQSLDWTISRYQIQLTDKILGKGGWGSVVEGTYCGCAVAVKQIHELILSSHNRGLFVREMDIASRCRHPCLLQFIGATNDEGSPLFVTELMELSLRALLEQRTLSEKEVSIISLDVARALNYLHKKKPSPIIHRDISSANVLLWRQGDQWRGKLSDYGAANFMQQTMTVAPGAVIYIAPEALTSNQTVKVDVYSFGVLLCEMCIGELPDPDKRDQQVAMVKSRLHRSLIRECLQSEPRTRPDMEEIIKRLEEPL